MKYGDLVIVSFTLVLALLVYGLQRLLARWIQPKRSAGRAALHLLITVVMILVIILIGFTAMVRALHP